MTRRLHVPCCGRARVASYLRSHLLHWCLLMLFPSIDGPHGESFQSLGLRLVLGRITHWRANSQECAHVNQAAPTTPFRKAVQGYVAGPLTTSRPVQMGKCSDDEPCFLLFALTRVDCSLNSFPVSHQSGIGLRTVTADYTSKGLAETVS
ncbi:hypothetical protein BP00DRAFT_118192 [Aspergillus indologenus CBS 114.80]|uniref:Secreted protein n=1 Tax=Aspergillus indologenus CBS 114.80 TaxID=1450541 RepID=A0A2V5J6S6_9EURO|nr:hypothetical protein BP00DRAFT_118192 [Aspergillus indologenus CBS 114.80]